MKELLDTNIKKRQTEYFNSIIKNNKKEYLDSTTE